MSTAPDSSEELMLRHTNSSGEKTGEKGEGEGEDKERKRWSKKANVGKFNNSSR